MKSGLEKVPLHVLEHVQLTPEVGMQKKLTITVDVEVYDGLLAIVGKRRISRFLSA